MIWGELKWKKIRYILQNFYKKKKKKKKSDPILLNLE